MDWSSKAPDQKRSIPLVCELGLLEWRFAKLAMNEDYGEALQARARARMVEQGCKMHTWHLLTRVDPAGSLLLSSLRTSLYFFFF